MIWEALARYGTQTLVARHLGMTQSTVARKAKQYGLGPDRGPQFGWVVGVFTAAAGRSRSPGISPLASAG
jgi:Helix-turn-helix domain